MENVERANKRLKTATENHQRDLNAQLGILANKEKILKERLDGLNAKKAKTAQDNGDVDADGDDLIEINAGGKIIAAKRSTLTQFEGTRLEAVFSGRWDKKLLRDCNDRVFLDVNPSCFQAIVDYLNELAISPDDNPPLPPSVDDETKDIFRHQLELFGIEDKIRIVELESNIVKLPTAVVIQNWMKEVGPACDFELLYRSSRDGRNDCTFHSKCDDKGPTLTVIETSDGSIFGGYTDAPWSPKHGYSQSEKAFLFFIPGSKNKSPSIMKIKKVNVDKAICCNSSSGPTFGADLRVRGSNIYLAFGNTYEATPSEEIYSSQMAIKDMEVFAVTFTKEPGNHNNTGRLQVPKKTVTFSKGVNEAMNEKMDSLNTLEAELLRRENGFNDERKFTAVFANGKPEDVVTLNVSGSIMLVAKSSLMIRKKSHLATVATKSKKQSKDSGTKDISEWGHEDVVAWLKGLKGVPESVVAIFKNNKIEGIELVALGKEGMIDLGVTRKPTIFVILEEMKKLQSAGGSNATLIEHSPYCFEKIVDYLRLMRSYEKGLVKTKPACPVVRESERARFEKLVKHYFPRNSTKFILC